MLDNLRQALLSHQVLPGDQIDWLLNAIPQEAVLSDNIQKSIDLLPPLQQLKLDSDYIFAAILFLILPEDLHLNSLSLPKSVASHYQKLCLVSQFSPNLTNVRQAELFLKFLISITEDLQLLSLILALRLLGMQQVPSLPASGQRSYAEDTLSLYAPLANRLGIFWIKAELEDMSLRYVAPEVYYDLKQKVAKKRAARIQMVEQITRELRNLMEKENIPHNVEGRYKRFYSIYKKLPKVNGDFERIQDLIAFRILTPSIHDCYKALGYIHEQWEPKPGRFKDYIAKPKTNGYQSLHTTVVNGAGEPLEIQIRTYHMHTIAEFGVAAHWKYKEKSGLDSKDVDLYNKLRQQQKEEILNQELQGPNIDLLTNKIYVFTPMNDLVELTKGSTPVDFAYAIHSKVGDHITAAKANGRILRLDEPLSNGDWVEVITSPKQIPRQEWLKFVQSSKAKNKIRHALRVIEREKNRKLGWECLDREFKRHDLNFNRFFKAGTLEKTAQQEKHQSFDHILCAVGEGTVKPWEVVSWFLTSAEIQEREMVDSQAMPRKKKRPQPLSKRSIVIADGIDNMLIRLAKCCNPRKGDAICGYITHGSGITVHRADCLALEHLDPTRQIDLDWNPDQHESKTEPVSV